MMIILIILIQGYLYSVQGSVVAYGHYGTNKLKKSYAVMENVTWAEAFDICSNHFNSGRLFRKKIFVPHLIHDRIILKENGWDYSDIWIGFMSSGYSPWLMAGNTSCIKAYSTATETLPPLIYENAQCLVLNMSGTNYDDAYYSTPCSEHRAFLCQSQVKIGKASYHRYNDTIVTESALKYVPIKQTDHNTTEHRCWFELISNNSNALAFASVYHGNNGTCVTYYLTKLIWYPVKVEMENQSQAVSFVKSTGHKVKAWQNASYPIPGIITYRYSDNCFNYGVPTVSSTKKSTAARFVNSFSTYDSTQNTMSSRSLLSSAENNKLSEKMSSYEPTTESSTPRSEKQTLVVDTIVTSITQTTPETIYVNTTDTPSSRTSSGDNYVISSVTKTEKSMTTHVDYSYSTDSTDNYKTSFSNLFSSVSNKPSFKFSSKSPATETPLTNTEHPSTVYDKTVTEITDTAIISAITTEKSTQGPVSIVSTSKASDRIPNEFCLCPCSSTKKPSNEPFSINNLRLNKKTLSSYRRTLTSATDQRFSVLLIGWSGVFVLVMAVLMIIIPDILTLVKVIRKRKSKSKVAGIS